MFFILKDILHLVRKYRKFAKILIYMSYLIKSLFLILWVAGVIISIYLFKKTIPDITDTYQLYSIAFFYTIIIIALSLAFLPAVFQSGEKNTKN